MANDNGWISVIHKLPDTNGKDGFNQLVALDEPFFGKMQKEISVAYYETSEDKWYVELTGRELLRVTHWIS